MLPPILTLLLCRSSLLEIRSYSLSVGHLSPARTTRRRLTEAAETTRVAGKHMWDINYDQFVSYNKVLYPGLDCVLNG